MLKQGSDYPATVTQRKMEVSNNEAVKLAEIKAAPQSLETNS